MQLIKVSTLLIVTLFLSSCASTKLASIGEDTYIISKSDRSLFNRSLPSPSVIEEVHNQARKHCSDNNKSIAILNKNTNPAAYGSLPSYMLEFKCVDNK